jgi:hypothetical protein
MTLNAMQHIPLVTAYLCQDCNSIGNCATQCPACASVVLLGLSGILNRKEEIKTEISNVRQMPAYAA